MEIELSEIRTKIVNHFKFSGFNLKQEVADKLSRMLKKCSSPEDVQEALEKITDVILERGITSTLIDINLLEQVLQEAVSINEPQDYIFVYDAFYFPKFSYNCDLKKFVKCKLEPLSLHPEAASKISLFRERYNIVLQILQRHDLFSVRSLASANNEKYSLTTTEALIGSSSSDSCIILGMLVQLKEGEYHLEDLTGTVKLDLTIASYQKGIFSENSIIIVEGCYEDKVLLAKAIGFPPFESAQKTVNYFGNINFFGGNSSACPKASAQLRDLEDTLVNSFFVVISDIWLDIPQVLSKLKVLFDGYSDNPPTAFILIGNFSSEPYGTLHYQRSKDTFKQLAILIAMFPNIQEKSHFIIIPGPEDVGPGNIFPKPALPSSIQAEFKKRVPLAKFTTNPSRIQLCTKEIVIIRDDLLKKLCSGAIHFSSSADIPDHLTHTILSQAYLCPLPIHSRPIYWEYSHSLSLYPIPDFLILADRYTHFSVCMNDCTCVNPGPFSQNEFYFSAIYPVTGVVEDCLVPL
ncbi:DNA polymerase epsilon subunit 2 isoform X1 [Oopsacas minuta]|uniref:DNA polymerase epsilon subunit n=1 Tax=Oopsacas minuta TaxID=111878 RepID=A0AAV7K0V3_9METZ|nr:DNA polymerase epsilon subunit 2 isoform X1 [Oopsacas minuta]